tara:strand:- start:2583 stop:3617 length:1035 start_codon:yes stop_codon:yes gene_type:complete
MGINLSKNQSFLVYCAVVVIFLFSSFCVVLFYPQKNKQNHTTVSIKSGFSLSQISNLLYEKNIISNRKMFELAALILGKEKEFPVGTFQIINTNTNYDIIDQLVNESPEVIKVRILEGWDTKKIASYLAEVMSFDSTEVMELARDRDFIYQNGLEVNSLEGYFFPDTYLFFKGDNPSNILSHLIKQHKLFWNKTYEIRANQINLSKHEIVTLASIIEGEAIYNSERPKISAVYHNRLAIDMKLQADPTIQYIINEPPRRLLNKDLKIKSPYNTYLNKGLPPGPINSPGKHSLLAALFPEQNDFLFFVARGDGYHTFSTNKRDHDKAKRKFQKIRRKIKRERRNK